jgi:hypothetical protein
MACPRFLCAKGLADIVLHNARFEATGIARIFGESKTRLQDKRDRILQMYKEPLERFESRL